MAYRPPTFDDRLLAGPGSDLSLLPLGEGPTPARRCREAS